MLPQIGFFLPRRFAPCASGLVLCLSTLGLAASSNSPAACPTCVLGYPYTSSNPRTSTPFSESEIMRAFSTNVAGRRDTIKVWYNDERALALGVRRVIVTTSKGSATNDYPVTPLTNNPGTAITPMVGSMALTGDQAGTDLSDRPIFPALFITDITTNQNSTAGDWQFGGTAIAPHAVFGTWKTVVRKVDKTRSPAVITLLTDNDPSPNHWNLGSGDAVPAGAVDLGYGAEIRWNVDDLGLLAGHNYRLYFMMHDGDQNRVGGDVGHACLNVTVVHRVPLANNDAYSVNEDTTLAVAAPGVLANDTNVDGDGLTAILVSGPAHGSVALNPDGSFRYLGAANYNGPDSFTYKANDGATDSLPATVSITVLPVDDAPIAINDTYTINEDTLLSIAAPGVLANDTDIEGDHLTAILVSGPAHGSLTLNADGSFRYVAATNYNGPDSFTYKANDGFLDSTAAKVTITVQPVDDAPIAVNDAYTINEDMLLSIAAPGVLANDTDVEGDHLTAILVSGPAHGSLTLNADGSLRYLAASNYNGPDSFTYKANDGFLDSTPAKVTITVLPVNDAPIAVNDAYTINEDMLLSIVAPGVLANDTDVEGDQLTAILVSGPAHGNLTLNVDGSFRYLGVTNYNGPDSFTYKANDGALDSGSATVNITIQPVNDAPSFTKGPDQLVNEDAAPQILENWADNLSPGPPDEAGQTLVFLVTADTTALFSAQPAISPAGTLSYTPASHAYGVAHLTVLLRDNGGTAHGGTDTSAPQTFVITVNAPPTVSIVEPTNNTIFIAPANITVIADAHDVDGTVSQVQIFQGATLLLQTNSAPYFTVWTNVLTGAYQFTARATDNAGASTVSSPVNVTVLERPPLLVIQPPRFNPQTGLFEEMVRVLNPTPAAFSAVRVVVRDLAAGMQVFNASGKTNGIAYLQSNLPILPSGSVDMTIEYYVPNFQTPNPTLTAEVVGISAQAASLSATLAPVTRKLRLGNGDFLMEFSSLANRIYFVQYTSDLKNWGTAWPSIAGTGNRIQWIDNGPPRTQGLPIAQLSRFYRIVLAP